MKSRAEPKQWCVPIIIFWSQTVSSLMALYFVCKRELAYFSGWGLIFETLAEFMHLCEIVTCVTAAIDVDMVNGIRRYDWLCGQNMVRPVRRKGRQLAEVSGWFSGNIVSRQPQGYMVYTQQQWNSKLFYHCRSYCKNMLFQLISLVNVNNNIKLINSIKFSF